MPVQALTVGLLFLTADAENEVAGKVSQAPERGFASARHPGSPAGKITKLLNAGRLLPLGLRPTL
jgi:hypothetical protein